MPDDLPCLGETGRSCQANVANQAIEYKSSPDVAEAHRVFSSSERSSASRKNGSKPVMSVLALRPCRILTTTEIGFNCPFLRRA